MEHDGEESRNASLFILLPECSNVLGRCSRYFAHSSLVYGCSILLEPIGSLFSPSFTHCSWCPPHSHSE